MKPIFFTVGPSQLYSTVQSHILNAIESDIPSISHRGSSFHEIFFSIQEKLRKLFAIPSDYRIYFLSSGTEAMERVIENCVRKKSAHIISGSFAERFHKTAEELKKKTQKLMFTPNEHMNIEIASGVELLCITQNETSTGVQLPMEKIYVLKKTYKNLLIAVDIVSSAPYVSLDYSLLDYVFFSVQKGFGLPAGLGVAIVSPQAYEKSQYLLSQGCSIGTYHSFLSLERYALKGETPETPNVLGMYLFERVLNDLLLRKVSVIQEETEQKAKCIYDFLENHSILSPSIAHSALRSQTTIVANVKKDSSQSIIKRLKHKGLIVGSGYGKDKEKQIRIGNFPTHTMLMIEKLIRALKDIQ